MNDITCCLNCPPTDAAASTDVPPGDIKNAPPPPPPPGVAGLPLFVVVDDDDGGGGDLICPPLLPDWAAPRVGEVGKGVDGSGRGVNSSRTRGLSEERKRLVVSLGGVSCVVVGGCLLIGGVGVGGWG